MLNKTRELTMSEETKRELRNAFGEFATGVTIVTARTGAGEDIGITANSFSSVSLEPPMLLWSIGLNSQNLDSFQPGFRFAVNILCKAQEPLARHFGRSGSDQFLVLPVACRVERGLGDVPLIGDGLACFECVLEQAVAAGDHKVLIARVERFSQGPGVPLVFHRGKFIDLAAAD